MLVLSFAIMFGINLLQRWSAPHAPVEARRLRLAARARRHPDAGRLVLIIVALAFLGVFLVMPLVAVFVEALARAWALFRVDHRPEGLSAIRADAADVAAIAVPLNFVFGVWRPPGRSPSSSFAARTC